MVAGTLQSRVLPEEGRTPERVARVPDFAAVYEGHFRYVWRCLRSLGVADAQLEDALQDVFIVVQKKLADFDGGAALGTWLYAIAVRVARKYRARSGREHARRAPEPEAAAQLAPHADLEGAFESNQRLLLARRALDALDDDKREVFVLARVEQMSAVEIASVIGVPLNTVYSRLRAARQIFEAEVARLESGRRKTP